MAESFQGRMRDECPGEHLFFSMGHARAVIAAWRADFNTARPHSSLGYKDARRLRGLPETAMAIDATLNG